MTTLKKYLFLDRDGTLVTEPHDHQVDSIEKFHLVSNVIPSLLALKQSGFTFVMITNQDGLGTERYPQAVFDFIQKHLLNVFESQGIAFDSVRICPHLASENCSCRKPQTGLVRDLLATSNWSREESYMIGDRPSDLEFARNLGVQGIQLSHEKLGWSEIASKILFKPRIATRIRKTRETQVEIHVNLDALTISPGSIHTGLAFFDHMLEQLSFHGGFSLAVKAQGDLPIDDHHLVEDVGIVLGEALAEAMGEPIGIARYGFYLPMDEATTQATMDVSGRSTCRIDVQWNRDRVGELSTEMIPHFFKSFTDSFKASLHLKVQGENTHHMAESCFKAVGRCLRQALQRPSHLAGSLGGHSWMELRAAGIVPSTKGIL